MALLEYVLLALLGSGAAAPGGSNHALGAESITQPNGGVVLGDSQKKPTVVAGEKGPDKVKTHSKSSHRRRHRPQPQFTRHKKGSSN